MSRASRTLLFSTVLILLILIFPEASLSSAREALNCWFSVVLPSLFPFMIAVRLLGESGAPAKLSKIFSGVTERLFGLPGAYAYVYLLSALSGYPMSARLCTSLCEEKLLEEETASTIACLSSVCGPMFLVGVVSSSILKDVSLAPYILLPQYCAPLLMAGVRNLFVRDNRPFFRRDTLPSKANPPKALSAALGESIEYGARGMLTVGGFMMIFFVLKGALQSAGLFPSGVIGGVLTGVFEMTSGCLAVGNTGACLETKIMLLNMIVAFSGLAVIAQSRAFCPFLRRFVSFKIVQSIVSMLISALMLTLLPPNNTAPALTAGLFFAAAAALLIALSLLRSAARHRSPRSSSSAGAAGSRG